MFLPPPPYRRAWLIIFALAATVRLVLAAQLVDSPALVWHHWSETDMHAFWSWSGHIADGDLLSRLPQRPPTAWHTDVAQRYLHSVPTDPAAALPASESTAQLWRQWQGGDRFYQEPLYPYLVALLRAVLGLGVLGVLLAQMLLGLAGLWCLMDATRRLMDDATAVAVGLLATLCAPLLFYEVQLLRETLAITLFWALVRQWAVARDRPDVASWVAVGLLAALGMLTRAAMLPFVLVLAAWSLRAPVSRWPRLFGWLLGAAVPLGLLAARNLALGVSPWAIAGGGVFAVVAANAPGADPMLGLVLEPAEIARLLAQTHGDVGGLTWAALRAQWASGGLPALFLGKLVALLQPAEIPNNASLPFFAAHAPVLRGLTAGWWLVLPLAIVGAGLAVRDRRGRVWLVWAGLQIALLLITQPLSRYRLPLLAGLLPLAALALVDLARTPRLVKLRSPMWGSALVLGAGLQFLPVPPICARSADHDVAWQFWAQPAITNAADHGDVPAVIEATRLYLRGEPERWTLPRDKRTQHLYAQAHQVLADALQASGDVAGAAEERAQSARLRSGGK